jgi:glycosyltransferase involved in cell wall biosynthesis
MSSEPKVTIWIPSYNHARFLPAAIDSALSQTYKNIEIVVVDDGSTDESLSIAQAYASRHPDIVRVFTHPGQSNRGISATFNLCFEKSTGTYLGGLASDDLLHPHRIAEQVAFLERRPELDWVYGYAFYIDEDGRKQAQRRLFFGMDITHSANPVERLILRNAICGTTVLIRRDAATQIEPFDETLVYSDWDFWVRLAARHKMGFLPRARVGYRLHSYNTSIGTSLDIHLGHCLEVMEKLRRESERLGGLLARPRTQALLDLQCSFFSYAVQDEERARVQLATAFTTDPTLQQDSGYFCRWLNHWQRNSRFGPGRDFGLWALAHLPAETDGEFVRAVARHIGAGTFGRASRHFDRVRIPWERRRPVLNSLFRDPRVWRERELFTLHLEALVGSRLRKGLRRLLRPRTAHSTLKTR